MNSAAVAQKRQATEAELLQENVRLRGDLLTIARRFSHDLRTPLGNIINAGEALRELAGELDPSAQPLAVSMLNSAEELSQRIKRVAFVLKASADAFSPEPMAMGEAVFAALERLESKIIAASGTVSQPASWPEVSGVREWFDEIWWNLLINVLQHGGARPRLELGWGEENQEFQFWVCDRGSGVPADRRNLLFQPFDQLHETNAARGLGLPIVRRLVELHGGNCGYEPNADGGACFFFALPAGAVQSQAKAAVRSA
jgi:signal transduction histidine kinase